MIKFALILTIFLPKPKTSNCSKGCISCNFDSNTCNLCDFIENYYLLNKTCTRISIPNCFLIGKEGACQICADGFFVDPLKGNCISAESQPSPYCETYGFAGKCQTCEKGFYLSNGECLPPTKTISNCERYKSNEKCKVCATGYIPSIEERVCVKTDIVHHCKAYSYLKCEKCPFGFRLNANFYLNSEKETWFLKTSEVKRITETVCEDGKIPNCKEYDDSGFCRRCFRGFYYDEVLNECLKFPENPIAGCQIYKSASECRACVHGLHPRSVRDCVKVKPVEHCVEYDRWLNFSKCVLCAPEFFLDHNFLCKPRAKSLALANCSKRAADSDSCLECALGFASADDGNSCLAQIPNCEIYESQSPEISSLNCKKCANGFYAKASQCLQGTVNFCLEYAQNRNSCKTCLDGRFLRNGSCEAQQFFRRCQVYSSQEPAACLKCLPAHFPFKIGANCRALPALIENCEIYAGVDLCAACAKGMFLDLDRRRCLPMPAYLSFCEKYEAKIRGCVKCARGKVLADNGTCGDPLEFVTRNCREALVDGSTYFFEPTHQCKICAGGSLPYNSRGQFVCLEERNLKAFNAGNINGCVRYNEELCENCQSPLILAADRKSCVASCADSFQLERTIELDTGIGRILVGGPTCLSSSESKKNCLVSTIDDEETIKCVTCRQGFSPLVNFSSESSVPFEYGAIKSEFTAFNTRFPIFACEKIDAIIPNCLYFFANGNHTSCLRCEQGFQPSLDPSTNLIKECRKMNSCLWDAVFGGIAPDLNSLFSCHKCSQEAQIPILGILNSNSTISKARPWANSTLSILPESEFALNCVALTIAKVPENCSLGAFVANSKEYFCVACKPGFRAIYNSDNRKVARCAKIAGCHTHLENPVFNGCGLCGKQRAFLFTDFKTIAVDICVETLSDNCLAADFQGVCFFCQPGYFLNSDSLCEIFKIHACADKVAQAYYPLAQNASILRYFYGKVGCQVCENGYKPVFDTKQRIICAESSYQAIGQLIKSTKLIKHCPNYEASLRPKCAACQTGYIPTDDFYLCVLAPQNCVLASSRQTKNCAKCERDHISVNGVCVLKDIGNCEDFENSANEVSAKCRKCEMGFVLASPRECVPGKIPNCAEYMEGDQNRCLRCFEGFIKIQARGKVDYCYPASLAAYNCKSWDEGEFAKMNLVCRECSPGFLVVNGTSIESPLNSCLPFNAVENCIRYDDEIYDFAESSLNCKECNESFFYNNITKSCQRRKHFSLKCEIYSNFEDTCVICGQEFMLNEEKTDCLPKPNGIYGCLEYSTEKNCELCASGLFWDGKTCKEISEAISDCEFYSDQISCKSCRKGFYLEDGNCHQASLQNCKTYNNANSCDSCFSGWGLISLGKNRECVPVRIQNCERATSLHPFACLKCAPGHFKNEKGHCQIVRRSISSCIYYSTETTCEQCEKNAALSIDGKFCDASMAIGLQLDNGCEASAILAEPECSRCELGYYLFNKRCIKCDVDANCLVCNPEFPAECLICKTGFFQTRDKECKDFYKVEEERREDVAKRTQRLVWFLYGLGIVVFLLG